VFRGERPKATLRAPLHERRASSRIRAKVAAVSRRAVRSKSLAQDYRITRAWVVPPIVLALAKHPMVDEFDLSSVEYMLSGAAPLSAELEVACGKRLGCRMQQGYGLTETSPTTHYVPDDLAGQMPGSIGLAIPNTQCRIVDVLTGEDAPAGEEELCIRGPQVMKDYLNDSEATARTIDPDRWLTPATSPESTSKGRCGSSIASRS
jgi:long-subunit acyl-CoA synthetase (AMP-forming)